uniref:S5 DRBM domain-containing protein n=1 Tax=Panagrolaimus sp. ES5 TaxID=591445 RepID=A0AC34GWD5_9BILA
MALSLLSFVQKRHNTVNFFMRRSGQELWKTITSVSKSGQKKGRRSTRQPIRPLEKFYRIGSGPLKVQFPGLNVSVEKGLDPVIIEEQTEDELKQNALKVRTTLEESKATNKRRRREKLHPLERGFSGHHVVGQKLGPPPPVGDVAMNDFETYCLEVKRTSHMTRVFGRVHTMAALVFMGNGKGLGGYAVGKAAIHRTNNAIVKGMNMAARKLFFVELLENRTIYQDFYAECRNTKVFAQRRPEGFGLRCHPRLQKICEALGIKDIYVKVEGNTRNYLALTHAFVTGLLNQETHQQLAERKGLHVVEMKPSRQYFPEVIASPILTPLRSEEDLLPIERLKLDDFYGEGRYPLYKEKPPPFYSKLAGHLDAEWRKWPFRNQEKVSIRLLADGVVPRWTRTQRHEWAKRQHELFENGILQIPQGIGLSDIVAKKE